MERTRKSKKYYTLLCGLFILAIVFGLNLRKIKNDKANQAQSQGQTKAHVEAEEQNQGELEIAEEVNELRGTREVKNEQVTKEIDSPEEDSSSYLSHLSEKYEMHHVKDVLFSYEENSQILSVSKSHGGLVFATGGNEKLMYFDFDSREQKEILNLNMNEPFSCLKNAQQLERDIHWVKDNKSLVVTTDNNCSDSSTDMRSSFLIYSIENSSKQIFSDMKIFEVYDFYGELRSDYGRTDYTIATENGAALKYDGISYQDQEGVTSSKYVPALFYVNVDNPKTVEFTAIDSQGEIIYVGEDAHTYTLDVGGEYIWRIKDRKNSSYVIEIIEIIEISESR